MKLGKNKKGISIAECIIALALMVAVSIAAASIFKASTEFEKKSNEENQVLLLAGNLLECFRNAGNEEEFKANLEVLHRTSGTEPAMTNHFDLYLYEIGNYTLRMELDFASENDSRPMLMLDAINAGNEVLLSQTFYGRGGWTNDAEQ